MNYTLSEIARICGGRFTGCDGRVDGVLVDSRRSFGADEQLLFVAMRGLRHDGHDFVVELYRRGVRGFLVEREIDARLYPDAGFVVAERSLHALQALAADYRRSFRGQMVGITGSAGKTTVKEWIAQLAPAGMKVFRSPKSYNSQLGVPLSILMMRGDEDIALIEAGISRPGEMARLAEIIKPDTGILTNIGPEHSENFRSEAEKTAEKIKLFATCGTIIYYGDTPAARMLKESYPSAALVDAAREDIPAELSGGKASAENAALVTAFYKTAGVAPEKISGEMANLRPDDLRLDIREGIAGSVVVDDRSNSDLNSLPISIDYLKSVAGDRPAMIVLSDILFSAVPDGELYRRVADMVASAGIERFVGIGANIGRYASLFGSGAEFYATPQEFLAELTQDRIAGRAILVKGGRWAGFEKIVHHIERKSHTTVLEIDLDAMIHNLGAFRSRLRPSTRLMAMVKASSYGNGDYEVANMLQTQGVDYLAVAFADEGVRLREQGITMPIVVLNADSDSFGLMVANRLEPEIYNFLSLDSFVSAVRDAGESAYPIHIKLDTGMHRLGFVEGEMDRLAGELASVGGLAAVRSVFSHLAAADMPSEDDFTLGQIALFERMSDELSRTLPHKPLRHIANSAGIERFPQAEFDMCRLGIGLYGIGVCDGMGLRGVSRLLTRVVQVKQLQAGDTVGYGRQGRITRPTRLATIPVGYADGLDRRLGDGLWSVLVDGHTAPVVGRICMDSCMVDVTDIPSAAEGTEAVVFGGSPGNGIADMARVLDTIPYEVMTSISERVKRIYIKE